MSFSLNGLVLGSNVHSFVLGGSAIALHWTGVSNVLRDVEDHRKLHLRFVLLLSVASPLLESFEVQDEYLRSLIDAHGLECLFVPLTSRAVPLVASLQLFLLLQSSEALIKVHWTCVIVVEALLLLPKFLIAFQILEGELICS